MVSGNSQIQIIKLPFRIFRSSFCSCVSILLQLQDCYLHFRLFQNQTEVDDDFVPCSELKANYVKFT